MNSKSSSQIGETTENRQFSFAERCLDDQTYQEYEERKKQLQKKYGVNNRNRINCFSPKSQKKSDNKGNINESLKKHTGVSTNKSSVADLASLNEEK